MKLLHDAGSITQTCNGTCDHVRYEAGADKRNYAVELRDAGGECISCGPKRFVAYDPIGLSARWRIEGRERLKVEVSESIGLGPARRVRDPMTIK
ncbi:hypothetical protein [Phenylobacterium sp.]|uniref:hypothetical protein n=1 Tax=Phenylobacterium sp. TaxID=1871053 RepID=UPI002811C4FF|nr:hypothetical protein [Phenylobacterium sp.]